MDTESTDVAVSDKVFQQFGTRILCIACRITTQSSSEPIVDFNSHFSSPDWETVQSCRLISKQWNSMITAIFQAVGKPLLIFYFIRHPKTRNAQTDAKTVFQTLNRISKDFLPKYCSNTNLLPVKLALPSTIFYNDVTPQFFNIWEAFAKHLVEIDFDLPADSTTTFSKALQPIDSLKIVILRCTSHKIRTNYPGRPPLKYGDHLHIIQSVLLAGKNVTSFTLNHCLEVCLRSQFQNLILPIGLKFLDVPLVTNDSGAGLNNLKTTCSSLKHLIFRSPPPTKTYKDGSTPRISNLMKMYANSLEILELSAYADELGNLDVSKYAKQDAAKPIRIEIKERMHKLHTLKLVGSCWEIAEMESYQRLLPSLKHLKLIPFFRPGQIHPLYKSKSETVETLMLCCLDGLPLEMTRRFATNFPFLKRLCVVTVEFDASLKVCFREFRSLQILHVLCVPKIKIFGNRKRSWLTEAVSNIPVYEQEALLCEQVTLADVMWRHGSSSSLRNLKDLEEFKLMVKEEDLLSDQTDVSVMVRTTFFQMPKLKRVTLSVETFKIANNQKRKILKENIHGLTIEWLYSHRFEEYYDLF